MAPLFAQEDTTTLSRIALGSCNRHDRDQPLWEPILSHRPDLWIWLGDNVYGDTHNMDTLRAKYDAQKEQAVYKRLRASTLIIGTWDDHDYGINDGGKHFAQKEESQQLLLDFLDVPEDAPQRNRPGVYHAYTYGPKGKQVKIIVLDTRYFRDTLARPASGYQPNFEGTILGEEQWRWVEGELANSSANVHIIATSIQFLAEEHEWEKWANFPKERQKLISLLQKYQVKNPIFISGDRHIGEIARYEPEGADIVLVEMTSSGLTHTWGNGREEPNAHRQGKLVVALNFGLILLDWENQEARLEIRGKEDELLESYALELR